MYINCNWNYGCQLQRLTDLVEKGLPVYVVKRSHKPHERWYIKHDNIKIPIVFFNQKARKLQYLGRTDERMGGSAKQRKYLDFLERKFFAIYLQNEPKLPGRVKLFE